MFSKTFNSTLLLAVLLSLLSSIQTQAQTISGTIIDAQNREPLAGATVRQVGTSSGAVSESDGGFTYTLKEGAPRRIQVSFLGYRSREIEVPVDRSDLRIFMEPETYISDAAFVEATRVDEATPFSYTNITKSELEEKNLGQDVPYLLRNTPSVVTTSDAGAGVGYTGIRIRGVDPARINVTINGVPVNDAESHGVFWVDLPDIASSVENIQIQRGVGTSTNGAGAFGASINLQTSSNKVEPFAEVNTGIGSFNTRKANIMLGSGLMENGWMFEGRLSKIVSDGYIDRADADLYSFYLSGSKRGERSLLKADVFSGKEITYQAWYGVEESVLESGDRTYNEAGTEKTGAPYENQVDNYRQDYYQLHYSYRLTDDWTANASLHYTKGQGYYEEYKADELLVDYGINSVQLNSDLVRRRWLDNDFYGGIFSTKYTSGDSWNVTLGGGYNIYDGGHFGEVIWARYAGDSESGQNYYDNDGKKKDLNIYGKLQYFIDENLNAYADLQLRNINYTFLGIDNQPGGGTVAVDVTDKLSFFNPKAGVVYRDENGQRAYLSFGVASKEPTRDEYVNSTPQSRPDAETLYNVEAGFSKEMGATYAGVNLYGMFYKDQLVLTGQINDVGAYIRDNVDKSYRMGIELEGGYQFIPEFGWAVNATFSKNKIDQISEFIDDYDNGGQIEREFSDTDIAFSPSVILNSVFSFTKAGFTTDLTTKYVSKQYLDNTQDDARSLDAYLVNDLSLSYKLTSLAFAKAITGTLQISNILDAEYETNGYTYGYIWGGEQRVNYYYPQAGTNFLFQIKWEF